jgi:hypothetical protein
MDVKLSGDWDVLIKIKGEKSEELSGVGIIYRDIKVTGEKIFVRGGNSKGQKSLKLVKEDREGWRVWRIRRMVDIEDSHLRWGEGESDRWEFKGSEENFVRGRERWVDARRFSDKKGSATTKDRVRRAGGAGARNTK